MPPASNSQSPSRRKIVGTLFSRNLFDAVWTKRRSSAAASSVQSTKAPSSWGAWVLLVAYESRISKEHFLGSGGKGLKGDVSYLSHCHSQYGRLVLISTPVLVLTSQNSWWALGPGRTLVCGYHS